MLGKIFIKNLIVRTRLGITAEEKAAKQDLIINIKLWLDITQAAKTDKIENTVSYSDLCRKIIHFTDTSSFNLFEALANALADICLKESQIEKVKITLEKPHSIAALESAGITLTKSREENL